MRLPVRLLASAGAVVFSGAALGQTPAPGATPNMGQMVDPSAIRALPAPGGAGAAKKPSAAAEACANNDGKIAPLARAEACGKLIDSGKWKGGEIAWAYANRCFALFELKSADKALADCDKAIELDGKNAVAFQTRGMIEKDGGQGAKALADFDKAVELGANNPAIFSDRGDLLIATGDADKALADYDRLVARNGAPARAYVQRGGAWLAKGDPDRAMADFDQALKIAPNDSFALFNLGAAAFLKGDKAKAVEALRQSVKRDPANIYTALWLFLATGGAEGKAQLQENSAKFSHKTWPWPVVQFDLGEIGADKVFAAAGTPDQQCEARFYVGAGLMPKKADGEAKVDLAKAAEICPKNYFEYFGAVAGLKALGGAAAKDGMTAPAAPAAGKK
jgi:tetratricopeptide (TPR) repeat protein